MFLNQTPHRYYPLEYHTTGLPFLNHLPSPLAFRAAKRFSKRVAPNTSWVELLRDGVRGGTEREILNDLKTAGREHRSFSKPITSDSATPSISGIRFQWLAGR
jgi:hypothetical protein